LVQRVPSGSPEDASSQHLQFPTTTALFDNWLEKYIENTFMEKGSPRAYVQPSEMEGVGLCPVVRKIGRISQKGLRMRPRIAAFLVSYLLSCCTVSLAATTELSIPGSGNPEFALRKLADQYNATQSEIHVTIPISTGTAGALRDVETGTATLGRVGRPLKKSELDKGIVYLPLGRDPVVFVGGAEVTVRNLTEDQILKIYAGGITDWSALGGQPAHIRVIGREVTDASRRAIGSSLKPFADMAFGEPVKVVNLDPEMVALLDRFPTSLGFLNTSALKVCSTPVVMLDYNGIVPSVENMKNGLYPFWIEFGLIYKPGSLTVEDRAFLDYLNTAAAQDLLRGLGIQPLRAKER